MVDRQTAGAISAGGSTASTAAGVGIGAAIGGPAGAAVGGMIGSGVGNLFSSIMGLTAEEEFQGPSGGELSAYEGLSTALTREQERMGLTPGQVERQYQMGREGQEDVIEQLGQLSQLAATPFEREGLAKVILGEAQRVSRRTERRISELDIEADARRTQNIARLSSALSGVSKDIRKARTLQAEKERAFETAKWKNFSQGMQASMQAVVSGVAYGEERGLFADDEEQETITVGGQTYDDVIIKDTNQPEPITEEVAGASAMGGEIAEVLDIGKDEYPLTSRLSGIWRS